MTKEPKPEIELEEVQRRLAEIQHRKRGGMRWDVSKHTAEMALVALEGEGERRVQTGKGRRRKRKKRLL